MVKKMRYLLSWLLLSLGQISVSALDIDDAWRNEEISFEAYEALRKYSDNPNKLTPLNYAIDIKDLKSAEALIESSLGINSCESIPNYLPAHYKYTPATRLAALSSNPIYMEQAVKLLGKLLTKKIDLDLKSNNYGLSQEQELLIAFVNNPNCKEFLKYAELIILKRGMTVNFSMAINRWTPVQFALQHPNIEGVKLLLRYGADLRNIDCISSLGCFHLDPQKFKDLVIFLIKNGADLFRQSDACPSMRAVDCLLKKITSLPIHNEHYFYFKREVYTFLINLGAVVR